LPVTKMSLRSSRSTKRSAAPFLADRGAEADPTILAAGIELDVGHPGGRNANPPASPVGQPQDALPGQGLLNLLHESVGINSVGQFDLDLLRGVGDTDTDVHAWVLLGQCGPAPW